MSELKSRPPAKPKQQAMEAFIAEAEGKQKATTAKAKKASTKPKPVYPWEEASVRDDVIKVYNLRLPEAYLLKLKYIAENTPDSMQKFCLRVMQEAIDAKITELNG
jgi:hypothetical protein